MFDQIIHATGGISHNALVNDRKFHLVLELQTNSTELPVKAGIVDFFQRPGAYRGMNGHRGFDDQISDVIDPHGRGVLGLCVLSSLRVLGGTQIVGQEASRR